MQSLPPLYTFNRKLDIRHTPLLTQAGYFPHPTLLQLRLLGLTHTAFKVKYDTLMNRKWPYTPSDYIPTYGVVQKPPFWSHHRLPLSRAWLNSLLKFYATKEPHNCFYTPIWQPFQCISISIWRTRRHEKTIYK